MKKILATVIILAAIQTFVVAPAQASTAYLLGKVFLENFPGCSASYWLGRSCSGGACESNNSPSYTISWSQAGNGASTDPNECNGGNPRYSFESQGGSKNPTDINGPVFVTVDVGGSDKVSNWSLKTTTASGVECKSSSGSFPPTNKKTISVNVYTSGSCNLNHLWFWGDYRPPVHTVCQNQSCVQVSGTGANACSPAGNSCSGASWGGWVGGATCGTTSETRTCQCSGPCCTGCLADVNGPAASCGGIQSRSVCRSEAPNVVPDAIAVAEGDTDGGSTHIQTRRVKINWQFADTGSTCGLAWGFNCNGNTNTFSIQVTGGSLNQTFSNIASDQREWMSNAIFRDNTTYTIKICANNGIGTTCSLPKQFIKESYPSGKISGQIGEFDADTLPTACYANGASGDIKVGLTPNVPGVNLNCTYTHNGSPPLLKTIAYDCTVELDNVNNDPNPVQTFTVGWQNPGSNPQYTGFHCEDTLVTCSVAGTSCSTGQLNFDQNQVVTNNATKLVYLNLNPNSSFYKLKNTSYQDHDDPTAYFPVNVQRFDTDDTDWNPIGSAATPNYFIIGSDATNFIGTGPSLILNNNVQFFGMANVSRPGYKNRDGSAYDFNFENFKYDTFRDYVKARKVYTEISAESDIRNGVNLKQGDIELTSPPVGVSRAVVVVSGTVTLTDQVINPAKTPYAVISQHLVIGDEVRQLNGIYIADTIELQPSELPLKINGNLASLSNAIDTTARHNANGFQPSIFVNFVPDYFLNLLSDISTFTFERIEK